MSIYSSSRNPVGNRLLAALPQDEYERLLPKLESVSLSLKQILYEPNEPIEYVYFPTDGIISLVNITTNGGTAEAATVGSEGMVGISLLLGANKMLCQSVVQVAGHGVRMRADVFIRVVTPGSQLYRKLLRYTLVLMNLISQTVVCNSQHPVEQRCCRWLLTCSDRVKSNSFLLTQEFLAQMLGVQRPTVSVFAATLQQAGLIRYSRGKMTICDRKSLEATTCECYWMIKQEFERLLKDDENDFSDQIFQLQANRQFEYFR